MPNWCQNNIEVSGPADKLALLVSKIEKGEGLLSSLYPCPETLRKAAAGSDEFCYQLYHGSIPSYVWKWDYIKDSGIDPDDLCARSKLIEHLSLNPEKRWADAREKADLYKHNKDSHGFLNWYDWCIASWGTKWDVPLGDAWFDDSPSKDSTSWSIVFDSAWSPPLGWLEKVSKDFPGLEFKIEYSEFGCYFAGFATYINGDAVSHTEGSPDMKTSNGDLVFGFCGDELADIEEWNSEEA